VIFEKTDRAVTIVNGLPVNPFFYSVAELYAATLINAESVIPAKAGIQKKSGFRVKPEMTNGAGLMSLCISQVVQSNVDSSYRLRRQSGHEKQCCCGILPTIHSRAVCQA